MLARMVDSVGENPTVADSRLLALAFLSFSAFLIFDELSHQCCSDIVFEEDKMLIHIASSSGEKVLLSQLLGLVPIHVLLRSWSNIIVWVILIIPLQRGSSVHL